MQTARIRVSTGYCAYGSVGPDVRLQTPIRRHRSATGYGIFAETGFRRRHVISRINGRLHHWRDLIEIGGTYLDNAFRFGPETYLAPTEDAGRYLNHSCDPNAAVVKAGHRLLLVAVRSIRRGEEIVIDYSTIIGDDDTWTMRCRCGSHRCRRTIRRVSSLPLDILTAYIEKRMIPTYILRTMD